MAKWIGFSEARELYLDRQDTSGHGSHCLEDAKYFSRRILSALIDGSEDLCARTCTPSSFCLKFASDKEDLAVPLLQDAVIPPQFWIYWQEAIELFERQPLIGLPTENTVSSFDDTFEFTLTGAKDGGVIVGHAESVQLLRDAIGLLPRPRGNPAVDRINDIALLDDMERIIQATGCGIRTAAAQVAGHATGASLDAKISRLRRKFAQRRKAKSEFQIS